MDLAKHEQSLMNIRSKYAKICANSTQSSKANENKSARAIKNDQFLYQTPIKISKNEEQMSRNKIQQKQQYKPYNPFLRQSQNKSSKNQTPLEPRSNMINKRPTFSKDKGFDEIIAEREQQLTERMERNKQILSKSKEVRENQIKYKSVQKSESNKENKDKKCDLQHLKMLLKDKNYIFNDNFQGQKKQTSTNIPKSKDQSIYTTVKNNFTEKMKQNLIEDYGKTPKVAKTINEDKALRAYDINERRSNEQPRKKNESLRQYSIKTPIPPPKESSPTKVASIFENTNKITERIQALLSR